MAYEWPMDPADFFKERGPQMRRVLPPDAVDAVQGATTDMWRDGPGGWPYEWSKLARAYAENGDHSRASLAYGWARFPQLVDEAKREAHRKQLEEYLLASPGFPVNFERRVLTMAFGTGTIDVPVHLLSADGLPDNAPIIVATGGVDGWKMDLHGVFETIAQSRIGRVMAFDIAGTGESVIPMTPNGGSEMTRGVVAAARAMGAAKVAHLGISMGGYYSAWSGLEGIVDAAVDLGGPVEAAFSPSVTLHYGMADILANAQGYNSRPALDELVAARTPFALSDLLAQNRNAPMLVINGADDVHVPQADTLVFQGRRDTEVHLLSNSGHCAVERFPEAMRIILFWLGKRLA